MNQLQSKTVATTTSHLATDHTNLEGATYALAEYAAAVFKGQGWPLYLYTVHVYTSEANFRLMTSKLTLRKPCPFVVSQCYPTKLLELA